MPTVVQDVEFHDGSTTPNTDLVFAAPCAVGNVVLVWHACRDSRVPLAPSGFSSHPDGNVSAQFSSGNEQDNGRWFYRVVESGDSLATSGTIEDVIGTLEGFTWNAYAVEVSGVDTIDFGPSTSHATDATVRSPAFDTDDDALIFGGAVIFSESVTLTPDTDVTEVHETPLAGPFHPTAWVGWRAEDTGSWTIGGTAGGSIPAGWGFQVIIVYGPAGPGEPPPVDPGYEPPDPGRAILEIYVHDEDATRWGTATWSADLIPTGTEGIWSGAGWQDVTPQGVRAHVIWGSTRPERGILAAQEAQSWMVETYDPDRKLDPGNVDSPWYPQIVSGLPIRISHQVSGTVIRTAVIDRVRYRHKAPDYRGVITASSTIAIAHRAEVPDDSTLGDTLRLRIRDAVNASGLTIGGIPLLGNDDSYPEVDLSARIEGSASLWEHIRRAGEEVLWVIYEDNAGTFHARPWGGVFDRGREITYESLEDLESATSEDGVYSAVRVLNADGTVVIDRVAAPLPRYGRRYYTEREDRTTIDPEAWADAVLADRAWPGVTWTPGTVWAFDANEVEYFATLQIMERVHIVVPGAVDVTGKVLGMELWVEQRTAERARWLFLPKLATDGSTSLGITSLVADGTGDYLIDDASGTDYLVED